MLKVLVLEQPIIDESELLDHIWRYDLIIVPEAVDLVTTVDACLPVEGCVVYVGNEELFDHLPQCHIAHDGHILPMIETSLTTAQYAAYLKLNLPDVEFVYR